MSIQPSLLSWIGEVVENDTEANLKARVAAEIGACAGKKAIASKAKELGYDAIHDTVIMKYANEARVRNGLFWFAQALL